MTAGRGGGDLSVVHRAGRVAALQASLALAAVLLVVGAVVFAVDARVQNQQIADQLRSVAATADDVTDPPPGMLLGLRDLHGNVAATAHQDKIDALLNGPAGFSDIRVDGTEFRAYVTDEADGRVAALLNLRPYEASRSRLLLALAIAELAGIVASVAVVVLLTRRSIRPLNQALQLQRRFVADASHELRAPLTVLHTRAQLVARRAQDTSPEVRRSVDELINDSRLLGEVIEDLLSSAAMAAGSAGHEPVDVAAVAAEVGATFAELAAAAGVALRVQTDRTSAESVVRGTPAALRRALSALVDNALAHEHPGGTVVIAVRRDEGAVVAEVRDDGTGVDPAAMERLFERFARGDRHTGHVRFSGARDGGARPRYGIGLALVREIAHAHGGDVSVTETPGGGATFTLTLPAASASGRARHRRRV